MKPTNLLVAAVVLLALSGAVWWSKRHPEAASSTSTATAPTSTKIIDVPDSQLQAVTIQRKDRNPVTVERKSNKWAITQPQTFATDQDDVASLASALSPVTADEVVEDKTADFAKYGLANPGLHVTVQTKKGKTDQIEFGDDVPAGSLVYARLANSPKVYAVSSSVKSSLDKSANDLRDKRLLTFDTNNLTRLELASGRSDVEFGKSNGNDWQIVRPQQFRADNFQVEELLRKLTDAKMDLSVSADTGSKLNASYATALPLTDVKVTDASGTQTLEVRKSKDDYYARSSATAGAYKISSDLGKELEKKPDDFRNKKIFDFGFSDPTKIELTGSIGEKTLTRSGTDWKSNNQTMDPGTAQALIDKVRDLAATTFVTSGFSSPQFGIAVTSNDGKRVERVEFAKAGDAYIGRRGTEAALYQLDSKGVSEILDAGKALKLASLSSKK